MRFNPEASWGANAGLDVPRKAVEDVKVCLSSAWDDFVGFSPCHFNLSPINFTVLVLLFVFLLRPVQVSRNFVFGPVHPRWRRGGGRGGVSARIRCPSPTVVPSESNVYNQHFRRNYLPSDARGPTIPFRLGRTDAESGETSPKECGLPDADKGSRKGTAQHVRDVFYRE